MKKIMEKLSRFYQKSNSGIFLENSFFFSKL